MDQTFQVINQYQRQFQEKINRQIVTALTKIRSNPESGKMMKEVRDPELVGLIWRSYVGGNNGHRLIYIYLPERKIVLPVYLSPETRPNIDYNKIPWNDIAESIYNDFENKKYEAFSNWQPS